MDGDAAFGGAAAEGLEAEAAVLHLAGPAVAELAEAEGNQVVGGHYCYGAVVGEDGGEVHFALAEVGDVGGWQAELEDAFFEFAAEGLDDEAVNVPAFDVDRLAEGPLGFGADGPAGAGVGVGHDAANNSAAIGSDGIEREADAAGLGC